MVCLSSAALQPMVKAWAIFRMLPENIRVYERNTEGRGRALALLDILLKHIVSVRGTRPPVPQPSQVL